MNGIGMGELFMILFVAFIVVGPEDLPKVARKIGKVVKSVRKIIHDLTDEIDI